MIEQLSNLNEMKLKSLFILLDKILISKWISISDFILYRIRLINSHKWKQR